MGVQDAAEPTGAGPCTSSSDRLPSAFSVTEILQHCHQGGSLEVKAVNEAAQAQVQSIVESELAKLQLADVSYSSTQENSSTGAEYSVGGKQNSQQRLKSMLTLLAVWHAKCLRAEKFVCAKQLCATLMAAEHHSSASSKKMIRNYVKSLQQVCKKMHGFVLDIPSTV